ncbi:MAG: GNAT family N-acetyltransferase [Parvibaculum sp.]|nr:GNAT family N-acetyltransferase [Parvibaculum sp.]MBO6667520.1 N-acetyltransferase [Parvibaculum sp.]MBO6692613.1 N-acetyltransferase [Parvibaculum sp.]MBO6714072.1 N-acetyltransferase [Parvibaculum sp.]HAC57777.1 N-acetyltransferase [Rhodobiaceae bacterium]
MSLPPSPRMETDMKIVTESGSHTPAVEKLVAEAFGPDRFAKTVYRLRDGVEHDASLALVALDKGEVVGTLRFWPIEIEGGVQALLLGPLVASPDRQGEGVGSRLMKAGLARAAEQGHRIVVLVGDEPYYRRFGFTRALARRLELPGWVDEGRFLARELASGALAGVSGVIGRPGEAVPVSARVKRAA